MSLLWLSISPIVILPAVINMKAVAGTCLPVSVEDACIHHPLHRVQASCALHDRCALHCSWILGNSLTARAAVQGLRASVQAHPLKASAVEPELFAPEELLEPKQDRLLEPSPRAESDPGMANGPSSSGQAGHKWFANWFGKDHESSHDISAESPLRQPPFVSTKHMPSWNFLQLRMLIPAYKVWQMACCPTCQ